MASTAQEALIAELLGDVGRLHDAIKDLPKAMAPACGAIVRATKEAQMAIEGFGAAQESRIKVAVDKERECLRADVKVTIRDLAKWQAEAGGFLSAWKVIAIVAVVAVGGSFLGYKAAAVTEDRLMTYAAYGRAVSAAWDRLDDEAKSEIRKNLDKED